MLTVDDVRNLIIDGLSDGTYPLGSKLPTARELALKIGSHRNTVAKAYRQLADLGLVASTQGRGTFVVDVVGGENRQTLAEQLFASIETLVTKARRIGISKEQLGSVVVAKIESAYADDQQRLVFVECNPSDIEAGIDDLERQVRIRIGPLLLDQLEADPAASISGVDVVVTSLFHLKEVSEIVRRCDPNVRVIGVNTQPDEEAISQIAQIPSESRVGIVVSTQAGGPRFANQVRAFADVTTTILVKPGEAELRDLEREVDVVVCSRSQAAFVKTIVSGPPVIVLPFHVSKESASRVVEAVSPPSGAGAPGLSRSVSPEDEARGRVEVR